jgi:hypothetical protein
MAVLAMLFALLTAGCGASEPTPNPGALHNNVDLGFVQDTDRGPADALAGAVVVDGQEFWRNRFPDTFRTEWTALRGVYSVDTANQTAKPPPCTSRAADLEGAAQYCAGADALAWDRAALLPVLKEEYGDGAVVLVVAHELGHAVQKRTGLDSALAGQDRERYPAILVEAMADCYAGAFVRWAADGHAPHLRLDAAEVDNALLALITFRDAAGADAGAATAHGDAFDRVSAFQDGYQHGPADCAGMTTTNRTFTARAFTTDHPTGGHLSLTEVLDQATPDLRAHFNGPPLTRLDHDPDCAAQGPVTYCANQIQVGMTGELPKIHADIGDYATVVLLASRYGLATGPPPLCAAGAYTNTLLARKSGYTLSPGDLDEAARLLLRYDYASRDAAGKPTPTGYARFAEFRTGMVRTC